MMYEAMPRFSCAGRPYLPLLLLLLYIFNLSTAAPMSSGSVNGPVSNDLSHTDSSFLMPAPAIDDAAENSRDSSSSEDDGSKDNSDTNGGDDDDILEEEDSPPLYPSTEDATQQILGRVASAATCLVAGIEYTHGQQIYRADPCEFCLCLDGEMFCWWQECPPATVVNTSCKDRYPFTSPCTNSPPEYINTKKPKSSTHGSDHYSITTNSNNEITTMTDESNSETSTSEGENNSTDVSLSPSINDDGTTIETIKTSDTTTNNVTTSPKPTVCIVLGVEYKIGQTLPHNTGNCVQCECGAHARIMCSPHGCAPPEDSADFRSSGQHADSADVF